MSENHNVVISAAAAERIRVLLADRAAALDAAFVPADWFIGARKDEEGKDRKHYRLGPITVRAILQLSAAKSAIALDPSRYRMTDIAMLVTVCSGTEDSPEDIIGYLLAEQDAGRWDAVIETVDGLIAHAVSGREADDKEGEDEGTPGLNGMVPVSSFAGWAVDLIASEYGWTYERIMNLPLAQLWQFQNAINVRKHGARARAAMSSKVEDLVTDIILSEIENRKATKP